VLVLTKADPGESNTGYAQGGVAAAFGPDDSPALHARDTMDAGDGLCRRDAVDVLVHDGPRYVQELLDWGAAFDRDATGAPSLGREAAHSVRRVLHAKDATGREIGRTLWARASKSPRVRVLDVAMVLSLRSEDGVCRGATFIDRSGEVHEVDARRTLLATGGAGQVFRETTNPAVATGDVNHDGTPDIVAGAGPGGGPQVRVFDGTKDRVMGAPLTAGDCNSCHTEPGVNGAPGRIMAP